MFCFVLSSGKDKRKISIDEIYRLKAQDHLLSRTNDDEIHDEDDVFLNESSSKTVHTTSNPIEFSLLKSPKAFYKENKSSDNSSKSKLKSLIRSMPKKSSSKRDSSVENSNESSLQSNSNKSASKTSGKSSQSKLSSSWHPASLNTKKQVNKQDSVQSTKVSSQSNSVSSKTHPSSTSSEKQKLSTSIAPALLQSSPLNSTSLSPSHVQIPNTGHYHHSNRRESFLYKPDNTLEITPKATIQRIQPTSDQ